MIRCSVDNSCKREGEREGVVEVELEKCRGKEEEGKRKERGRREKERGSEEEEEGKGIQRIVKGVPGEAQKYPKREKTLRMSYPRSVDPPEVYRVTLEFFHVNYYSLILI